jgi:hypothetical protein
MAVTVADSLIESFVHVWKGASKQESKQFIKGSIEAGEQLSRGVVTSNRQNRSSADTTTASLSA